MIDYNSYLTYEPTAAGLAKLYCDMNAGKIRFAKDINRFYVYSGKYWEPDTKETVGVKRSVLRVADWLRTRVAINDDFSTDDRKRIEKLANTASTAGGVQGIIDLVKTDDRVWCYAEDFARNAHLLNFQNGTLDIKADKYAWDDETGSWDMAEQINFYPHKPEDMLASILSHNYDSHPGPDGEGVAPEWDRFLLRMCDGDKTLAKNLEEALAYSLYGLNPQQLCVFLVGAEAIGKTQVLQIVMDLAGSLAGKAESDLLKLTYGAEHDKIRSVLRGKHFVMIDETSAHMKLDELKFKELVGAKYVQTRQLQQEPVQTRVTWTICIATNELPEIPGGMDGATARRLWLFPLSEEPVPARERDIDLPERIVRQEGEQILWRMSQHLQRWFGDGQPVEVHARCIEALDIYRADSDTVREFCQTRLHEVDGGTVTYNDVHTQYIQFCKDHKFSVETKKRFIKRVAEITGAQRDSNHCRFKGIDIVYEAPIWGS